MKRIVEILFRIIDMGNFYLVEMCELVMEEKNDGLGS